MPADAQAAANVRVEVTCINNHKNTSLYPGASTECRGSYAPNLKGRIINW